MEIVNYLSIVVLSYLTLKYKKRSEKDLFTDVYHRYFLFGNNTKSNKLIKLMRRAKRSDKYNFGVLFIDLDHFKEVNDIKGHDVGDQILLNVVDVLKQNTRKTVRDWIIRYGGDEFIVIYKKMKNAKKLKERAERVLNSFKGEIGITASIGGSIFTYKDEINEEMFMKKIDAALYGAKDAGRDCVRIV